MRIGLISKRPVASGMIEGLSLGFLFVGGLAALDSSPVAGWAMLAMAVLGLPFAIWHARLSDKVFEYTRSRATPSEATS